MRGYCMKTFTFVNRGHIILLLLNILNMIFNDSAPRPIQSVSRNIRDLYVCLSVHVWKPRLTLDWRLLVREHIANIGLSLHVLIFLPF